VTRLYAPVYAQSKRFQWGRISRLFQPYGVTTLCKGEAGLREQLALYQIYYNFCLPHASLHLRLPQPEITNGSGSAKRWQPRTPAMAAGLTDHVWTLREMLLFRVPPWPQPAGV
jgi:hypothetical protein